MSVGHRVTRFLNGSVFSTVGEFLQVDNCRILRSMAFALNYVSNRENIYGRFSDVATAICSVFFETYALS